MDTATKEITLEDLARSVNRLIETNSNMVNPLGADSSTCVYYDFRTDRRCLMGQALYNLTGRNVPEMFEGEGIDELLGDPVFCENFGLPVPTSLDSDLGLRDALGRAQNDADSGRVWGAIAPINGPLDSNVPL